MTEPIDPPIEADYVRSDVHNLEGRVRELKAQVEEITLRVDTLLEFAKTLGEVMERHLGEHIAGRAGKV
jgi:hypothetical protein